MSLLLKLLPRLHLQLLELQRLPQQLLQQPPWLTLHVLPQTYPHPDFQGLQARLQGL
jgi:hypothetical protein